MLPLGGEHDAADLDNLARIRLAQGEVVACQRLLEELDWSRTSANRLTYVHRHSLLTKASLLLRQGRFEDARSGVHVLKELAKQADDHVLE